ncbi:MAG: alpha/beta hydrolase [Opitutaceae bacterium]
MPPPLTRKKPLFASYSEALDTEYVVYVEPPDGPPGPPGYPTVILVDGDYAFDPAAAACRNLRRTNLIAPIVLAAVGYGRPFGHAGNRRGRDYTPDTAQEEPLSGGADRFLAHLTGPIWADLADRFSLSPERRVVGGHSLGGLFALHALFQMKPFFSGAIVGAPSLWWADRRFLARVDHLRDRKSSLPGRLFLGIGERDTESMKKDMEAFETQLAARPFTGLTLTSLTLADRDHYDVAKDLFRAGLQNLLL